MSFPRQMLVAVAAIVAAGSYPLYRFGTAETVRAASVGVILAVLNVLAGYKAIEYAFAKSTTTFFKVVLGGMGMRMFALAGLLVLLIKVLSFDAAGLVIAIGVCYVVFLTLEILYIQKKVITKHQP